LAVFSLGIAPYIQAGEPLDLVKTAADKAVQVLKDPALKGPEKKDRIERLKGIINTAKGEESPVVYRLKRTDGKWKVYDAVVENISIVNNYRSQFDRVIS
jgi:phospholipid transport system substrate-binding protein